MFVNEGKKNRVIVLFLISGMLFVQVAVRLIMGFDRSLGRIEFSSLSEYSFTLNPILTSYFFIMIY